MSEVGAPTDAATRRAASDPQASVLLEAPAGSGKTAVLTERYLRLLCTVRDPAQILAITFTRKAAAEMRARVLRALAGEFVPHDPNRATLEPLAAAARAHMRRCGFELRAAPQLLRIQTIDAFNYALAAQLPVAARVGGALTVTEAPQELYARAARLTLTYAESDAELAPHAQRLFERLDNHWVHLEGLLAQLLRERAHWLRFVAGESPRALIARVDASLAALTAGALGALRALIPAHVRARAEALPGVGALGADAGALAAWQALARLALAKDDWRRLLSEKHLGTAFAAAGARAELRSVIAELEAVAGARQGLLSVRSAPPAALGAEEAATLEALSRVLAHAAAELQAQFALAQRVDHTYISGAARQALTEEGAPTELALRLGLSLQHILVDEFQDTSLAQYELLAALTAGWEAGDGRTLFVVGDPMQSIYRFRDAEVGLFLAARRAGVGGVRLGALRLTRNFRAVPELVAFANEVFAQVFPARDELRTGAVAYTPSEAARHSAAGTAAALTLRLFAGGPPAEAAALAAHVRALRSADPHGSMAVLVSAHAHAVPVIAALEAIGVPVLGVDLVPLRERQVVQDLVQLTRALCDLSDRLAWLTVLRAPWCGARLASLNALSQADEPRSVWQALSDPARRARCAPEDQGALARLQALLAEALAARGTRPFVEWLEGTWMRLGAPDAYTLGELEDARALFDALAERLAGGEWQGAQDFEALLANLHSTRSAPGPNPVQVMTIHRAKGLEFTHVFVPALARLAHAGERRLLRWIELPGADGTSGLVIAPCPAVGPKAPAPLHEFVGELLRAREAEERKRLLYVAVTRARETLWLSGAPPCDASGQVRVDRRSLLGVLFEPLRSRFVLEGELVPGARARLRLTRLRDGWRAPEPPAAVPLAQLPEPRLPGEPPEFSWVGETQRHVGTLVHAWLARLSAGAAALEPENERARIRAQLRRLGVPAAEEARACQAVIDALTRTLADERGRWVLDPAHGEARAELPLSGVVAGALREVVVDRTFVDAGTRWVIDFKTSRHEGAGLEGFLDSELTRYREQLEGYVALARGLGPEPVRAALYFPLLQAFRELPL